MNGYQPAPDTAERYLQGKLSEAEVADYELWLADHPDELELHELDLLMQEGFQQLDSNPVLNKAPVTSAQNPHNQWLWTPSLTVLAFLAGYLLSMGIRDDLEHSLANAVYVPVEVMRGSGDAVAELHLGQDEQDLVLMLSATSQTLPGYTVRLKLDGVEVDSGLRVIEVGQQTWLVVSREQLSAGQVLTVEQLDQQQQVVVHVDYLLVE